MSRPRAAEAWLRKRVGYVGDDCLIWPFGRTGRGYGGLRFNGGRKTHLAHRVMCELAHGAPPFANAVVSHTCGKGHLGCVNPRHVEWSTQKDNIALKLVHGTSQVGTRNGGARITEEQVLMIVSSDRADGAIAADLGVCRTAVNHVRNGRNWGWLTGKLRTAPGNI